MLPSDQASGILLAGASEWTMLPGREQKTSMSVIVVFVATAYTLSIALSLVVGLTGGHRSELIGLAYVSMFVPAVAVLVVSSVMNEAPRVRWDSFPTKYFLLALFLIPGVLHAVMLPLMVRL